MPGGKAHGPNRAYQKLCHDLIQELQSRECLTPYANDGVDIPFEICGTEVTFDAVLKRPNGDLVVIESKRWASEITQALLFAFWGELEWLRRTIGVNVDGIFMTKTRYESGAIKTATHMGIKVALCEQDQTMREFLVSFLRFDPDKGVVKEHFKTFSATLSFKGELSAMMRRGRRWIFWKL
jgi:hypothetical protein